MDMQDNTVFREVTFPASTSANQFTIACEKFVEKTYYSKSSAKSTTNSGAGNTASTNCASNLVTLFGIPYGNDLDSDASFAADDLIQAYGMSENFSVRSRAIPTSNRRPSRTY